MKQKVVIKVSMNDQKSRKRAMKVAVGQSGVISVALGHGNDQIEVIGEGIDPAELTISLRKNMAYAELLSVNQVTGNETTEERNEVSEERNEEVSESFTYSYGGLPRYEIVEVRDPGHDDCCTIM